MLPHCWVDPGEWKSMQDSGEGGKKVLSTKLQPQESEGATGAASSSQQLQQQQCSDLLDQKQQMVEALKNHCHKTPSLCDLGTRCWCTFATKLDHLSATKQNWYLFANIEPGAPGCGKQPNNANICFILLTQIHIICFQTVGKPAALDLNQMVKYSQHLTFSWKIKV